jgi:hypothetical protein
MNRLLHLQYFQVKYHVQQVLLLFLLLQNPLYSLLAQPNLTVDNTAYNVNYNGSYQDFTVPANAGRIILNLKGGDGGKARIRYADCCLIDNSCNESGGVGASVSATFDVGNTAGKIPPGSIIRFIVGGVGESGNNNNSFAGWEVGAGGGATGILYKAPSASSFEPLVIAGGGGGAYQGIALGICAGSSAGRGGNYGNNGDGGGGVIGSGGGGSGGNGGGGNELAGGGGGGYLSDGDGVTCVGLTSSFGLFANEAGEGHKAESIGSPGGTSEGCTAFSGWKNGGFGYGSGGSGSDSGGGGGGYSGGGKGGTEGGGGGGGSYVNALRIAESGSDGGSTGSPANGTASYQVIPRPDNDLCADARTLTCGGNSSGSTQYATDEGSPSDCNGILFNGFKGVWFKFTGTGDVVNINTAGSDFDTKIGVYTGTCGALTCFASNDDVGIGQNLAALSICSVKDVTYYIYLTGFGNSTGNYQISMSCSSTPPSINCPANIAGVPNTTNLCSGVVPYTTPVGTDNCPNPITIQTAGISAGGVFPVGVTTNIFKVTDNAGITATCSFTVTVNDTQLPSITCPANIGGVPNTVNLCSAVVPYSTPIGTDNCPSPNTIQTAGIAASGVFPVGVTTNIFKVTDAAGNTRTCAFTVTVLDTQLPVITCPSNMVRSNSLNQCSTEVTYGTPVGTDNCSGSTIQTAGIVSNGTFPVGVTTNSFRVTDDAGNTATCSFTIMVVDAQPPSVICPANIIRPTDPNLCSAVVNYTTPIYSDNCAGGSAVHSNGGISGAIFQKGITTVVWQATDAVGLTKTCSFTITVTDGQAPAITCPANIVRSTDAGQCSAAVAYPNPIASDNCSLPATPLQWISGGTTPTASGANSTSTFQKGTAIVTWKATDGAGLTKTCTFRVTVNDTEAPTMTCPAAMNLVAATNTCNAVATYTNPTFTDNCAPTSGTATRISGLVSGSTFPVGNSNVVFQATDAAGNTRRCTMVVTVTDNQPPVINCPPAVVLTGTGTPCTAIAIYPNPTASDNCAATLAPFLITGLASGSVFPAGVTTNTFRALAPNGQSSQCSFSVTVNCGGAMGNIGTEVRDADLSVQQHNSLDLKLAPNPALSTVTVSIEGVGAGGGALLVFDAVGRLVLRQVVAENQRIAVFQVDGAEFTPGLYRVNLRTETGMVTKTLVVVK